ncbi:pyridoxal phosphate-dependent aminotransferase [Bacillus sp. AGMB 02131]|uniref:Pyridoxal phosphate-dependent aminotransferase n=1 Tax=Peribacillus faecalis TaxID=2772559 RepID=A0A927CY21_9BACI|nr:pyridoxal phosphate-dependent aminotransferase [Peribacillus faecalis]MBD3109768.1 pyridoxal phosphate-dependent aminotransferase [Peribacillus faecalis]
MTYSDRLKKLPVQFFATLVQKVNSAIAEGRDIINLGQGNPDQPTPPHIVKALQEAAEDTLTHKYSPFRGLDELKEAAAQFYYDQYGVTIDPKSEVAILFGTKAGLVELPMCLLNEGEMMLLPDPGYPDYLSGVVLANVNYETIPLTKENQFLPDYNSIPDEQKHQAKLMYLNYPNNPTGATASRAFFDETVAFAKKHNISVLHDFAYGAIGFDGKKPVSFLEAEGAKDVGIEMYTLSKTYNMAGWRVGFAVGNSEIIEALNLIQDHLYVSLFPAVQKAAVAALAEDQSCVNELVSLYGKRRNTLIDACRKIGWDVDAPTGSFFAWLPVPTGFTSESFADYLLEKADVAVAAGNGFGKYGEGYIRVGLLVDEDRLIEAIERIGKLSFFS